MVFDTVFTKSKTSIKSAVSLRSLEPGSTGLTDFLMTFLWAVVAASTLLFKTMSKRVMSDCIDSLAVEFDAIEDIFTLGAKVFDSFADVGMIDALFTLDVAVEAIFLLMGMVGALFIFGVAVSGLLTDVGLVGALFTFVVAVSGLLTDVGMVCALFTLDTAVGTIFLFMCEVDVTFTLEAEVDGLLTCLGVTVDDFFKSLTVDFGSVDVFIVFLKVRFDVGLGVNRECAGG